METKYIVGEIPGDLGFRTLGAIIFPAFMNHAEVAFKLNIEVVSAGFVQIRSSVGNGKTIINCYGKSSSCNVESNPERDNKLIAKLLGLGEQNYSSD